jgi:transcriptional regulator with XRE-family HTH domain
MLGKDLRHARKEVGLGVRELARITELSPEAISAIERGHRYPSLQTLETLVGPLRIRIVIGPDETIVERAY